jgi:tetratricopeptide (TPR) repeat protein
MKHGVQGQAENCDQILEQVRRDILNGKLAAAAGCCNRILSSDPDHIQALHLSGMIAYRAGHMPEAEVYLKKAIDLCPSDARIVNDLGLVYLEQRQFQQAPACFQKALQLNPRMAEAQCNLGLVLKNTGDLKTAQNAFQQAIAIRPDYTKAFFLLGDLCHEMKEMNLAIKYLGKAVDLDPTYVAAHNHLGICLMETGALQQAEDELMAARIIDPKCARTWCNLGNVQRKRLHLNEALRSYNQAILLDPHFSEAHFNKGLVHLLLGDFDSGWPAYEWRLHALPKNSGYPNRYGLPLWQGENLEKKSILVYDEQGFGDTFMFARYLKLLRSIGAHIVFESRPALFRLFQGLDLADLVIERKANASDARQCEFCIPLGSLAGRFHAMGFPIPTETPYLHASTEKQRLWRQRFSHDILSIGLIWSGSNVDPSRQCPPKLFKSLTENLQAAWYSLQKPIAGQPIGHKNWLTDLGPELADFSDTAGILANLDLVISIDTAVAHLAGAMGLPVWVLLPHVPDWRWFLERTDSPWYPSMRLFRQTTPGDWQTPLEQIKSALGRWIADKR